MTEAVLEKEEITPNKKQMECIVHKDGPMMVLAGPGTGKTFTVTKRIKYMLEHHKIQPEKILCLTYSQTAANEMKTKLVKEIGSIASAVTIHTYHAFCTEVIKNNPSDFELLDGLSVADDLSKRTIMIDAIREYKPVYHKTIWGDAEYFAEELIKKVAKIKQSQVTKEQYFHTLETADEWQGKMDNLETEKLQRERNGSAMKSFMEQKYEPHVKRIGKAKECWGIYEVYDKLLKKSNFIDFDDMIKMVLDKFSENEDLLKRVSSKYQYFLVDEYQDTNYSQNDIVFKLAEGAGNNNIFVVGDDDQIIFEFQGSKTDTLERFLKKFPETEVVCLRENNRSTQTILDFSYNLISQDKNRLEKKYESIINKKLEAKNEEVCKKDRKIKLHRFAETTQESNFIVEEIENLINSGELPKTKEGETDLSSVAILTRNNGELKSFADLLKGKNIKYQIKITNNIFGMKPSILVYFYLKALYNPVYYSDKLFGLLGAEPFSFEADDYCFLLSQNKLNHKDFIENIKINLTEHEWKNKEKVETFIETYDKLKSLQSKENLKNFVMAVCNETGILDYYIKAEENRVENILALKRIIDEAGALKRIKYSASLGDFIEHLDTAIELGLELNIDKDEYTQNAVQLVTLHGSKGRQFDYVYIPNLISRQWEESKHNEKIKLPIPDDKNNVDDEASKTSENLRLLFVGVTRAKYGLTLSYADADNGKPNEFTSYLSDITESPDLVDFKAHELSKEDYVQELTKSYKKRPYDNKGAFRDEVVAKVKDYVFSPTTLNRYLACPRNFLYTYIMKIPMFEGSWDASNYGSAVHKVLEDSVKKLWKSGKYPSEDEFVEMFKHNLSLVEFDKKEDREMYLTRGENSLRNYYAKFTETSQRVCDIELDFDTVPIGDEIIKGKIDRIEKNNDGTFGLYDYKTGRAKPKTQIADGKDNEDYLNQLRFYKLAYESDNPGSEVSQVGLIFVEEPTKSFYTTLTKEDNEIIKSKIVESYKGIRELNFEPSHCEKACQYCSFKHLCTLDLF